jgi:hypothetical protein
MRKAAEGEKLINIPIPEMLHTELKVRAAEEKATLKEIVVKAIQGYLYDNEPVDEEEKAAIEQGRKDYAEGKAIPLEKVMKRYGI